MGKSARVVCVAWLLPLAGAAWYLGQQPEDENLDPSALGFLLLGSTLVMTVVIGAALMAERRRWLWATAAAPGGGLLATIVISFSMSSDPENVGGYYPQIMFVEFSVVLLVPLVAGVILGALWLAIRRVRSPREASP
jgi:hypothetical protein